MAANSPPELGGTQAQLKKKESRREREEISQRMRTICSVARHVHDQFPYLSLILCVD